MTMLDDIDRRLLNLIQRRFPLTEEPYADLGRLVGTDADDVMRRIRELKSKGVVRLIGPVVDSRSLGYKTTLVAMTVSPGRLEAAEELIAGHPGISHGYERDHRFNVWFTLAVPPSADMDVELGRLTDAAGAEVAFSLPALRVFKIGAYFDMFGDDPTGSVQYGSKNLAERAELLAAERAAINELQQDLSLVPAPFAGLAERAGMDVQNFLGLCRSLQNRGIIRRYSASINHHRAGFVANSMTCWVCSPQATDAVGRKLAAFKEVSHCYERQTNALWPYNLFAMVHCRSRELCQEVAESLARETGLAERVLLYSTREFKKARVRYLA